MSTRLLPTLVFLTIGSLFSLPAAASSQARIVRLSDVQGTVQINKNGGSGFERAFLNLPITQGTQLKTLADGRAEVEFEDGSSLRLTPNSSITFSAMTLNDSGTRSSEIDLAQGMAYLNWLGKDEVNLKFSHEMVSLDHAAHFRVVDDTNSASLSVFKGEVGVNGPDGNLTVDKNKTASFDPANNDKSKIANKIQEEPLDSWDKDASSYHDQYATAKNASAIPYGYGASDLNYYGNFSMVPGYGMMWQPFFAGAGWDPFMDGVWGFYPGMGYMFASPYPWGWLPYRYGNWTFVPSMGWMWQPGGWNSYLAVPSYTATTLAPVRTLVPPTGTTKTVTIGRADATPTAASARMTMRPGTAGLFVPRGSINNMSSLNHEVEKKGSVDLRPMPQFAVQTERRSGFAGEHSGFDGPEMAGRSTATTTPTASSQSTAAHSSSGNGRH
jgi:FecR protein